jgi:hypothetical protein
MSISRSKFSFATWRSDSASFAPQIVANKLMRADGFRRPLVTSGGSVVILYGDVLAVKEAPARRRSRRLCVGNGMGRGVLRYCHLDEPCSLHQPNELSRVGEPVHIVPCSD